MKNLYLALITLFNSGLIFSQDCTIPGSSTCNMGNEVYCTTPAANAILPEAQLNQQYSTVVQITTDNMFQGSTPIDNFYIEYQTVPEGLFVETVTQNGFPFVFDNYSITPGQKACFTLLGTPTLLQNNQELKIRAVVTIGGVDVEREIKFFVNVVQGGTSSIEETDSKIEESIAPNPASSVLTINSGQKQRVEIFSVLGEKINAITVEGTESIDLSDWKSGVYFVRFSGSGKTVRLIKE